MLARVRPFLPNALIFLFSLLIVGRVMFFAAHHGGIEYDSGWFLGVARNMAERGIYASFSNSAFDEGRGIVESYRTHGPYAIQDEKGFVYFPESANAGPGYVFPQALILKTFGNDWWQWRSWPLLTFFGLLLFSGTLLRKLGNNATLVIFFLWLWLVPQLTLKFAYEPYGETIAMFYLLGGILGLGYATTRKKHQWLLLILAGTLFAAALLTKYVYLFTFVSILPVIFWQKHQKITFKQLASFWLFFFLGVLIPIAAYNLYRYLFITQVFNLQAWQAVMISVMGQLTGAGGGLSESTAINWTAVGQKLTLWQSAGIRLNSPLWVAYGIGVLLALRRLSTQKDFPYAACLAAASLGVFAWYYFTEAYTWSRHAWHGLFLAMMLVSLVLSQTLPSMFPVRLQKSIPPFLLSLVVFLLLLSPSQLSPGGISQANMVSLWHRHASEGKMERFPHVPPFPLKEQEAIRGYIAEHIPSSSRLYYHVFFMPEMSTISGRVFYPVERYDLVKDTLHKNAPAYLITGPQQQGELSKVADDYLPNLIAERCAKIVYQNPSHTLCQLK